MSDEEKSDNGIVVPEDIFKYYTGTELNFIDYRTCPIHGRVNWISIHEGKFKGKNYCEQCYIENVIVPNCKEVENK